MTARRRLLPRRAALLVGAFLALSTAGATATPWLASARDEEGWTAEFEAVCARTQDAMTLSDAELRALVERCDRLKPALEKLEEPLRKVYGQRLRACRELYQFVLDARVKEPAT